MTCAMSVCGVCYAMLIYIHMPLRMAYHVHVRTRRYIVGSFRYTTEEGEDGNLSLIPFDYGLLHATTDQSER